MGTSVFSIGISGLNAANSALSVASHNISNVNTPGYNRQVTQQAARSPQSEGYGFVGKGVDITSVSRVYDSYLDNQVKSAQSLSSYFTSQLDFMNQLDSLMADQDVGLSPAMQGFFGSLQTLSADPASIPARQTVINSAQALATKFRSLDTRLEEIHSGVNKHMEAAVDSINTLADKIATLNQQITALTAGDEVVVPNDLLDQRDQVVLELNKYIKASVVTERDGTYNVFIGNGQTLVLGTQSYGLTTQPDPADPRELQIAYVTSSGTNAPLSSKLLEGGELGGVLAFRDGALLEAETRLGDLAIDFSSTLNYQHELGVDLEGNAGAALFADLSGFAATPRDATGAFKVVLGDPKTLAVASNMKFESGSL
ncbi:MAG: flagellar hook-associated protein FlgK, partial [Pseudogulbenkiania sp.]|nr:flagellar hook-associated protein FlgK [Pseudogulbenkiania sp.]